MRLKGMTIPVKDAAKVAYILVDGYPEGRDRKPKYCRRVRRESVSHC